MPKPTVDIIFVACSINKLRRRKVPFQPFGYRFEISSTLSPTDVKTAIRSKKTSILDIKNGARGWIAGPFICLWFSVIDSQGPMLFGIISEDNCGTRIRGRAGSDLNGVLKGTVLLVLIVLMALTMAMVRQASAGELIVSVVGVPLAAAFFYWSAHKKRKHAVPLVRFLEKAVAQPTFGSFSTADNKKRVGLRLILNGEYLGESATDDAVQSAFMRVGKDDFLIIETAQQDYLQTASRDGGYVLEVRRGGPSEHYRALRKSAGDRAEHHKLTYDEVSLALASYISGDDLPSFLRWEPIDFS